MKLETKLARWLCNHYGLVSWKGLPDQFRQTWIAEAKQLIAYLKTQIIT